MRKKKNALGYTYLAPALISILLVTCLPIIYTVILSFTNYNMYHLTDYTFVGLENYLTVFSGSIKNVFFPVLGWTICFALLSTAGSYAMGLILAILLNNPHMKESKIYRAVLIVPWALPSTIAILAWQGLLNEQYGGINNLLHTIGIAWNVTVADQSILGKGWVDYRECVAGISLYDECLSLVDYRRFLVNTMRRLKWMGHQNFSALRALHCRW